VTGIELIDHIASDAAKLVLSIGVVATLVKSDVFNWGQIMAGALLGAAPRLIIDVPDGSRHRRADRRRDQGITRARRYS
jgi:hypothetical protein